MQTVNIHEANTSLSRLLARVAAGEDIVIVKAGKAIARLVPVGSERPERTLGIDKDRVRACLGAWPGKIPRPKQLRIHELRDPFA